MGASVTAMRVNLYCIALLLALAAALVQADRPGPADPSSLDRPVQRLCDILARLDAGEREDVIVSGIYRASFHNSELYDPEQPLCTLDVQPSTSVDFAPDIPSAPTFDRLIERDGRAIVTFEGVLEGPRVLGADNPSLPPLISAMNRVAEVRYGSMPSYRTRLIVKRIVRASAVPPNMQQRALAERPKSPVLTKAELPTYPEAAQRAGITGIVTVGVRVDKGRVAAADAISGDRLLAAEAVANIKTWEFKPTDTTRFTTVFSFELEKRLTGSDQNPRLELRLPVYVRIVGAANGW